MHHLAYTAAETPTHPLEFMLRTMRQAAAEGDTKAAMDAAKAAAPYVHPRLSSAEVVHKNKLETLSDAELRALIALGGGETAQPEPGSAMH
jgi:hypothetical protein